MSHREAHRLTRIDPDAHAVVKGEVGYWCRARGCAFTTMALLEALRHAATRQYDATHLPPVWPVLPSGSARRA